MEAMDWEEEEEEDTFTRLHDGARGALPGALLGWVLLGALPALHHRHHGDVHTLEALKPINAMFALMCITIWLVLFLTHPYVASPPP
jgi:hypothetical protein